MHPGAGPRLAPFDARATSLALPVPRVDPNDPNAGFLAGLMAVGARRADRRAAARRPPPRWRLRLRELRARLEMGELDSAVTGADGSVEAQHPDDWRVVWYRGIPRW